MKYIHILLLSLTLLSACSFLPEKRQEPVFDRVTPEQYEENTPIYQYIGVDATTVTSIFGQPNRIDPSPYGYHWYIYNTSPSSYIQFGVNDLQEVTTVFVLGDALNLYPFYLGQPYEELQAHIGFTSDLAFTTNQSNYEIHLHKQDLQETPVVRFQHAFAQLYFDCHTNTLAGVRFLNEELMARQRPYDLSYEHSLPEAATWEEAMHEGAEKQLFEIVNHFRQREQLPPLWYDEELSHIARTRSQDMKEQRDVAPRHRAEAISYHLFGETNATGPEDAISAAFRLLQHPTHRETLLHPSFTFTGVGVYQDTYTQLLYQPAY